MKPPVKQAELQVSDHAVLRYLERVQGFDVEAVRKAIAARVGPAAAIGAAAVEVEGFLYFFRKTQDGKPVLTTVTHNSRRKSNEARQR